MAKNRHLHNITSDAATDELMARRILRTQQAGYETSYSREHRKAIREAEGNLVTARQAVRDAMIAPARLAQGWIDRANAADKVVVPVAELAELLRLMGRVGLLPEFGVPEISRF